MARRTSTALGAYAIATGTGAVQLNGKSDKSISNSDDYTLKFYAGADHDNITIIDSDGKIPVSNLSYGIKTLTFTYADKTTETYNFICQKVS